jgi:hypothetical protein
MPPQQKKPVVGARGTRPSDSPLEDSSLLVAATEDVDDDDDEPATQDARYDVTARRSAVDLRSCALGGVLGCALGCACAVFLLGFKSSAALVPPAPTSPPQQHVPAARGAARAPTAAQNRSTSSGAALLDGCGHVYVDVGSNIGVQVRKLYEPSRYTDAPVQALFTRHFGAEPEQRRRVCAVGFEPSPKHTPRLRQLERRYGELGYRVTFMSGVAASTAEGEASFYFDVSHTWDHTVHALSSPLQAAVLSDSSLLTATALHEHNIT